ncbi:MAG TPA: hypothetical protein DCZ44_02150 [Flavobacteriaceae bacterium]|nr:hypothetical protein [Cryomorphaceae bacterium]HBB48418.1 hypothetical protein [Flavobacteriaceae bacterium]
MKKFYFLLLFSCNIVVYGQKKVDLLVSGGEDFSKTFDGMFEPQLDPKAIYIPQDVGNPSVPLDGGLTALLLAGGAAGYRQYQKKKKA